MDLFIILSVIFGIFIGLPFSIGYLVFAFDKGDFLFFLRKKKFRKKLKQSDYKNIEEFVGMLLSLKSGYPTNKYTN